jgi:hypothetical protein
MENKRRRADAQLVSGVLYSQVLPIYHTIKSHQIIRFLGDPRCPGRQQGWVLWLKSNPGALLKDFDQQNVCRFVAHSRQRTGVPAAVRCQPVLAVGPDKFFRAGPA